MTRPTRDRANPEASLAGVDGDAPMLECSHRHRLRYPTTIPAGTPRGWVVAEAISVGSLVLDSGALLRLDSTDSILQGCAGCEDFFVWSRFLVLSGSMTGQCVEFHAIDPRRSEQPVIPAGIRPSLPNES